MQTMSKTFRALLAAAALCVAQVGAAQTANADTVKAFLNASGISAQYTQTLQTMAKPLGNVMRTSLGNVSQGKSLNPAQLKVQEIYSAKIMDSLLKEFTYEKIEPELIKLYAQSFTQKELEDAVVFYNTPSGKALATKQAPLSEKLSKIGESHAMQQMPKLLPLIGEYMLEVDKLK